MYYREYVETQMISRLLDSSKDIRKVPAEEYNLLLARLNPLMRGISHEHKILGFTSEDKYSFMAMQLHQILRRNSYDSSISTNRFFIKCFHNLLDDLNRRKDKYLRDGYISDPLDDCFSLDNMSDQILSHEGLRIE